MEDAIKLCTTNPLAHEINNGELQKLKTRKYLIDSKDVGKKAKTPEIQGLGQTIKICCGVFVVLTNNLNVNVGLVNGSTGTVKTVFVDSQDQFIGCLVQFKDYEGPSNFI